MFLVTPVWSPACRQARFSEWLQATVLSVSQNLWDLQTLHVFFIRRRDCHVWSLLYAVCSISSMWLTSWKTNNTLKQQGLMAGEVNASDSDLVHISEHSCKALFYFPNEATCRPSVKVLRYISPRKVRGMGAVYSRGWSSPALPTLYVCPVINQPQTGKSVTGLSFFCQIREVSRFKH